jgi:hypothetical protein
MASPDELEPRPGDEPYIVLAGIIVSIIALVVIALLVAGAFWVAWQFR